MIGWLRSIVMGDERTVIAVERRSSLYELLNNFLCAYKERTASMDQNGSGSLLTAINNFTEEVRDFMANQEERLQAIAAKLTAIQTGVDTIQEQLADLKANNPDLEDEISAIEANVDALDTDVNPAPAPPASNLAVDPPDHQGGGGGPHG